MKRFIKSLNSLFYFGLLSIFMYGCSEDDQEFPITVNGGFAEQIFIVTSAAAIDTEVESARLAVIGLPRDTDEHEVSTIAVQYQRVVNNGELSFNVVPVTSGHKVITIETLRELEGLEDDLNDAEDARDLANLQLTAAQTQGDQAEVDRLTALIDTLDIEIDDLTILVNNFNQSIDDAPFVTNATSTTNNRDLLVLNTTGGSDRETRNEVYLSITNRPDEIAALQTQLMTALTSQNTADIERILEEMDDISMTARWEVSTPRYDRRPNTIFFQNHFSRVEEGDEVSTGEHTITGVDDVTDDGLPVRVTVNFGGGARFLDRIVINGGNPDSDGNPNPNGITYTVNNGMINVNGEDIVIDGGTIEVGLNDTFEAFLIATEPSASERSWISPGGVAFQIGFGSPTFGRINSRGDALDFPGSGFETSGWTVSRTPPR